MSANGGDVRNGADLLAVLGTPTRILTVSDLHLGQGKDPVTGRYCRRENFFADEAFGRLLADHHAAEGGALLVFNGDTFDFLRVVARPTDERDLDEWADLLARSGSPERPGQREDLSRSERAYGLRTHDYKSVWKLLVIRRGHPEFFAALERWVQQGGTIVFVKGNHDLELHWPLVQQAIRQLIGGTAPDGASHVHFCQAGFQLANVYFEHGHRFERTTTVRGPEVLAGERGDELRLPLGSFVNRYVVNRLDRVELFFSNIKPLESVLWHLLRRHPLRVFEIIWRGLPLLVRAARPYWFRDALGFGLFFASILVLCVTLVVIGAAVLIPGFVRLLPAWISAHGLVFSAAGLLGPFAIGALREIWPHRRPAIGEDAFAEGAYGALMAKPAAQKYDRRYGVLGHTHRPDAQFLRQLDSTELWYVNTGTWAPRFEEDRPDLMGHVVHSVVRFDLVGREYLCKCFEWRPPDAVYTPAILFEPKCRN